MNFGMILFHFVTLVCVLM